MKKVAVPLPVLKARLAFSAYLLISFIVTAFYMIMFGYSFWGTDVSAFGLDAVAWTITLVFVALQFTSKTRVFSWVLLPLSYPLFLLLFSNIDRFDLNVTYFGLALAVVMITLAILLNRLLQKLSKR